MNDLSMSIGKERYGFFKWRYYIKIDNVTDYYYSKSRFVRKAFELVQKDCIEELKLENALNKIL